MIFPLIKRVLISNYQDHISAGLDGACDYQANRAIFYAPFSGVIETYQSPEGGNCLRLKRSNSDVIEFAHLQSYIKPSGAVVEGDQLGITGNSGLLTPTAKPYNYNLHIQVKVNGKYIDPEIYLS